MSAQFDIEEENRLRLARLNYFYSQVFGEDLRMDDFDDRIRLQKLIYILRSQGLDFDYTFTWYLRGPYSPRLADDGYSLSNNRDAIDLEYEPRLEERNILNRIMRARNIITNSNNAELVASYLYLQRNYGENATQELNIRKPRYGISQIRGIMAEWNRLTRNA